MYWVLFHSICVPLIMDAFGVYMHVERLFVDDVSVHDELSHMLFVDGYMVTEFTGQPPEEAYTNISQSEATGVASTSVTSPPAYDDLYGNGAVSNGF